MNVRITHGDGKLPNLALMKLSHWHKSRGDTVVFTRTAARDLFDLPHYDRVYGSFIFGTSADKLARFQAAWPGAIVGGTGSGADPRFTVESIINVSTYEHYDYSLYSGYSDRVGCLGQFHPCRIVNTVDRAPVAAGSPRRLCVSRMLPPHNHPVRRQPTGTLPPSQRQTGDLGARPNR